ncbi:MAG: molybdopterin-guanine dinucleotide biosynthesis protein B [Candidatus Cloacimonetes bacterium]|nr:molybdopterin-guanine dinucleotide biosynthesis protein B [Candidatus Cloacimonadota bacterium]
MKVFSVAGYHHTGKTTAVCRLIGGLRKRGHKVMSIKDIHSEGFTLDSQGSNSWKHADAGAEPVFARGLRETGLLWRRALGLPQMLTYLDADWVVVEGMKDTAIPRIVCAETEAQLEELVDDTVFAISGKIADNLREWRGIPVISALNDPEALVELVERKVFDVLPLVDDACCFACGLGCYGMVGSILSGDNPREACSRDDRSVRLRVAGQDLHIVPFIQTILRDVVRGIVSNLKGVRPGSIELTISDNDSDAGKTDEKH